MTAEIENSARVTETTIQEVISTSRVPIEKLVDVLLAVDSELSTKDLNIHLAVRINESFGRNLPDDVLVENLRLPHKFFRVSYSGSPAEEKFLYEKINRVDPKLRMAYSKALNALLHSFQTLGSVRDAILTH